MNETQANYRSFLIRFWRLDNGGRPIWRATLQAPGSDGEVRFESPAVLWAYLTIEVGWAQIEGQAGEEEQEILAEQARNYLKSGCGSESQGAKLV